MRAPRPLTSTFTGIAAIGALVIAMAATLPAVAADGRAAGERVHGSFIVKLARGLPASQAARIAADHGGRVEHSYGGIRAFAFTGPDGAAPGLARDRRVARVEADRLVRATSDPKPDLKHMNRTDSYEAFDAGYTGAGVTIAVIDTGVQANHKAFHVGQVLGGKSCVKGGTGDKEGHGTATASNAAGRLGVAHDATIAPVRVFPSSSLTTPITKVICGLNWVDEQNSTVPGSVDVVNMSLAYGGSVPDTFRDAVQAVIDGGAVVVAATGNNGGATQAPAKFNGVIATSGLAGGTTMASFSADGGDMTAPAVNIKGAENGGGFSVRTGTSRASPQVAGAAAIILALDPPLVFDSTVAADTQDALQASGRCPDGEIQGDPGFCGGKWKGDGDSNAEPLVNAFCAGVYADPLPDPADVATCGF